MPEVFTPGPPLLVSHVLIIIQITFLVWFLFLHPMCIHGLGLSIFFFFFLPLFQKQLKSFRQDYNLNSWGKTSEREHACPEWMQHCCWPAKSGSMFKFWGMLRRCGWASVTCPTMVEHGCVWGKQQCHERWLLKGLSQCRAKGVVASIELCLHPFHALLPVLWSPREGMLGAGGKVWHGLISGWPRASSLHQCFHKPLSIIAKVSYAR